MKNKKIIAVFTANKKGGIVQLAIEVFKQLSELGFLTYCFLPDTVSVENMEGFDKRKIIKYTIPNPKNKIETFGNIINPVKYGGKEIQRYLEDLRVDVLFAVDSEMLTSALINSLHDSIYSIITIHDVYMHPSNDDSFKTRMLRKIFLAWRKEAMRNAKKIIVLSKESKKKFNNKYGSFRDKVELLTLGAHIPSLHEVQPKEVHLETSKFFLFFGRFDKYKGMDILYEVFNQKEAAKYKLIIAGDGLIDEGLLEKFKQSSNITLIKRYILDEEMIWLVKNSLGVLLPYSEASQSGVIPISYYLGVPVVVSNIPGLTQFVEINKNGFICKTILDYIEALKIIKDSEKRDEYVKEAKQYYADYMDWKANLSVLLESALGELE